MADYKELVLTTSGVNPLKCMRCGKCSGTCPSYDAMEYHPHQFVYMVEKGDIEKLKSEQIPEKLDDDLPQQAIVSAFRKYSK